MTTFYLFNKKNRKIIENIQKKSINLINASLLSKQGAYFAGTSIPASHLYKEVFGQQNINLIPTLLGEQSYVINFLSTKEMSNEQGNNPCVSIFVPYYSNKALGAPITDISGDRFTDLGGFSAKHEQQSLEKNAATTSLNCPRPSHDKGQMAKQDSAVSSPQLNFLLSSLTHL